MILEQIQILCKQKNITLARLERDLKFGNGTIRRWNDSPPSIIKVLDVAKYFNVDVTYLIEENQKTEYQK